MPSQWLDKSFRPNPLYFLFIFGALGQTDAPYIRVVGQLCVELREVMPPAQGLA